MTKRTKLTLRKETLRVLTDDDLRQVMGGTGAVPEPTGGRGCNSNSDDADDPTSPVPATMGDTCDFCGEPSGQC